MMRRLLGTIFCGLLVVTTAQAKGPTLGGGFERYAAEHEFVLNVINDLNAHSVRVNLEYCGFVYYDEFNQLQATPPEKGRSHSCLPELPEGNVRIFASYHTHAAYDPNSFNEYPSEQDMQGDFSHAQNGYISTPGGRLWFVDFRKEAARQLCGYQCLPHDRRYRETRRNRPEARVTLDDLVRIFERGLD